VANTLLLLVEQLMPQVVVPAEDAKKC
jgi:hypothetical protein